MAEKRKVGRPEQYREEYCEDIVEFMAEGKSVTQWAARVGVLRCTVYEWAKRHPEFATALSLGKQAAEAIWQDRLEGMMFNKDVNSPLVKLYFANRFGWRDNQALDHTSSDGSMSAPKQIVVAPMDASGEDEDGAGDDGEG